MKYIFLCMFFLGSTQSDPSLFNLVSLIFCHSLLCMLYTIHISFIWVTKHTLLFETSAAWNILFYVSITVIICSLEKILLFYNIPLNPIKLGLGKRSKAKLIVTSESEVSMSMSTFGQDKRKFKAWVREKQAWPWIWETRSKSCLPNNKLWYYREANFKVKRDAISYPSETKTGEPNRIQTKILSGISNKSWETVHFPYTEVCWTLCWFPSWLLLPCVHMLSFSVWDA